MSVQAKGVKNESTVFDVYKDLKNRGFVENIYARREWYPQISDEYIEVARLCVDTEEPWNDLAAYLTVYNYLYMSDEDPNSYIDKRVRSLAVLLRDLFPEKEFSIAMKRKVWLG